MSRPRRTRGSSSRRCPHDSQLPVAPPDAHPVRHTEDGAGQATDRLTAAVDQGALPDRFSQTHEVADAGCAFAGPTRDVRVDPDRDRDRVVRRVAGASGVPCCPLLQPVRVTVTRKVVELGRRPWSPATYQTAGSPRSLAWDDPQAVTAATADTAHSDRTRTQRVATSRVWVPPGSPTGAVIGP